MPRSLIWATGRTKFPFIEMLRTVGRTDQMGIIKIFKIMLYARCLLKLNGDAKWLDKYFGVPWEYHDRGRCLGVLCNRWYLRPWNEEGSLRERWEENAGEGLRSGAPPRTEVGRMKTSQQRILTRSDQWDRKWSKSDLSGAKWRKSFKKEEMNNCTKYC